MITLYRLRRIGKLTSCDAPPVNNKMRRLLFARKELDRVRPSVRPTKKNRANRATFDLESAAMYVGISFSMFRWYVKQGVIKSYSDNPALFHKSELDRFRTLHEPKERRTSEITSVPRTLLNATEAASYLGISITRFFGFRKKGLVHPIRKQGRGSRGGPSGIYDSGSRPAQGKSLF